MTRGLPAIEIMFLDGNKTEGRVMSFSIKRNLFHLLIGDTEESQTTKPIMFKDVKMIHFLKEEDKSEHYKLIEEGIKKSESASPVAYKLIVEFKDGEFLHGSAHKYGPDEQGFYIVPDNPESPYEKIYINQDAVKKVDSKRLVGGMLVDEEKITSEQLEKGLKHQEKHREQKIGDILKEHSSITDEQLESSLETQKKDPKKKLGEILIDAGYISKEQLKNALTMQTGRREKKLGQILIDLGYTTPNDICITLSTQSGLPWVDLSKKEIHSEIASIMPEEEARRLLAVPIEKKNNTLVVAIANPADKDISEKLKSITGYDIEIAIAYDGHIQYILDSVYHRT